MKANLPTHLLLSILSIHPAIGAETKAHPSDPAAHTVIVPYDLSQPRDPQRANRFYLDYADFRRLWELAKENRRPGGAVESDANRKPEAVIQSAIYQARIWEEELAIEARLAVVTRGAKWASLPLPFQGEGLAIASVKLDGGNALFREGAILIESPGAHTVELTMNLKRGRGWREAAFNIPRVAASVLGVVVPASDGRPQFGGKLASMPVVSEGALGRRIFTLPLGDAEQVQLTRQPARKRVLDAPPAQARTEISLLALPRIERISATLEFSFPGTERNALTAELDPSLQVSSAVVSGVPDAAVTLRRDGARQFLDVEFREGVTDGARLVLGAERVFDGATGQRLAPVVLGTALRREAVLELRAAGGLQIKPDTTDVERTSPLSTKGVTVPDELAAGTFRVDSGKSLRYSVTDVADRSSSRVESVYQLSAQKAEIIAAITLNTGRDRLPEARIGVPDGFEVQTITGPRVRSWHREGGIIAVQFDVQGGAAAKLVLHVARTLAQPAASWKLEPLKLPQFARQSGEVLIAVHAADEVRLAFDGAGGKVREVDPATVKSPVRVAPPFLVKRALAVEQAAWSADVTLARQAPRFSAEAILLAKATDLGLALSQQVGLAVEQGAVGNVTVRLPKDLPEARVHGAQVRDAQSKVAGDFREYAVTFQTDALDRVEFTMDLELPLEGEKVLPIVQVIGAARTQRFVILDNAGEREMRLDSGGAERTVAQALPYLPEGLARPQFYRAGDQVALQVGFTQLANTAGNAAIITLAEITTALRADGGRWDTVVYSIANRSLQFLPVTLPEGAELVEASVGGQAVRADRAEQGPSGSAGRSSRYLVPLIQIRAGELSQEVKLVYRFAGGTGIEAAYRFVQPELGGLSVERTLWNVWVPDRFVARHFDGNMEEVGAEGRQLEKLQSDLSDIARLNRALASGTLSPQDAMNCWGNLNKKMKEVRLSFEMGGRWSRAEWGRCQL